MACGAISSRPRLAGRFGASQQQRRDALSPSRALGTIPSIEPSCRLRRESTSLHSTVSKCFHFLPRIGTFQCLAGDGSEKNHSRARSVVAFKNLASPRAARGGGRVRLDRIWGSPFENRFRTNFPLVKELFEPAGAVAFRYGSPLRSFQRVTRFASRSNSCSSPISASKSLSGTMFGPSEGA